MQGLREFSGPNVAVDIAVLTTLESEDPEREPGQLAVLILNRSEKPRGKVLPGRFLREHETVADGIRIALREKAGIEVGAVAAGLDADQTASEPNDPVIKAPLLGVFDGPGRDPRSDWSMSLAHYVVLPRERLRGHKGALVPIDAYKGSVEPRLLFDHPAIVREAAKAVRGRYELMPDPDGLLTGPFTLAELKVVHEAVLGGLLQLHTFRRRMTAILSGGNGETPVDRPPPQATKGRPARRWPRRPLGDVSDEARRRTRLPRLDD
jgi:8-oxo-dGTP diphosphatase